jgi:hypothetical protein
LDYTYTHTVYAARRRQRSAELFVITELEHSKKLLFHIRG